MISFLLYNKGEHEKKKKNVGFSNRPRSSCEVQNVLREKQSHNGGCFEWGDLRVYQKTY